MLRALNALPARRAVPISIYGIHMHLAHHSKPHVQRHVIRVLWMVPIYALNAWVVRPRACSRRARWLEYVLWCADAACGRRRW